MPKEKAPAIGGTEAAALIIFGLDENERPHASWFSAENAELAERAAGIMRMRALRVATDEHAQIASELAAGRLFASGRAFVPFVKAAAYERLCGLDGAFDPPPQEVIGAEPMIPITGVPERREDIDVGSLVLATVGPMTGWYEGIVTATKGDGLFVLKWRDWPEDPSFERRSEHLALVAPVIA